MIFEKKNGSSQPSKNKNKPPRLARNSLEKSDDFPLVNHGDSGKSRAPLNERSFFYFLLAHEIRPLGVCTLTNQDGMILV